MVWVRFFHLDGVIVKFASTVLQAIKQSSKKVAKQPCCNVTSIASLVHVKHTYTAKLESKLLQGYFFPLHKHPFYFPSSISSLALHGILDSFLQCNSRMSLLLESRSSSLTLVL